MSATDVEKQTGKINYDSFKTKCSSDHGRKLASHICLYFYLGSHIKYVVFHWHIFNEL